MDKEQLSKILTFGIQRGVSDVHFAVGYRPHFRIKGDLLSAKHPPSCPRTTWTSPGCCSTTRSGTRAT